MVSTAAFGLPTANAVGAPSSAPEFIRWAELEIDPAQSAGFKIAAKAHAKAVLRAEPGVIAWHAVSEADHPARVHVFEMYQDAEAYQFHLRQAHFLDFRTATETMITRRQLHDVAAVRLGAKARLIGSPLVRIAALEIDPAQLPAYRAAVSEEIEASILQEPGVLTIYSVALTAQPSQLRFFEIYTNDVAYREHLESAHFKSYVETTSRMIRSRRLIETHPLFLCLKQH